MTKLRGPSRGRIRRRLMALLLVVPAAAAGSAFLFPGVAAAAGDGVSTTNSTVSAASSAVPADGTTTDLITVTLLNGASPAAPISGSTVSLSPISGTATVTAVSSTTNSSGQATFDVSSSTVGTATFQAQDTTDSPAVTITPTVTVGFYNPGEPQYSTVVASVDTVPADGTSTATVTVTLLDASNQPITGHTVSLSGGHIAASPAATGSNVTNSNGVATFTVADSTAETVNVTATDTTDNAVIVQTATIAFSPPGEAADSTVVASESSVPADGTTAATITVTLRGTSGLIDGHTVTLAQASPSPYPTTITTVTGTTGPSGVATFTVTATYPQAMTYVATDTTDHVQISATATVTFLAGPLDQANSTVVASPPTVTANGTSTASVDVTLEDANGHPIAGKAVSLAATGSAVVSPPSAVTTTAGVATFTVTDTSVETVTLTATDTTDNITLTNTGSVSFVAGPPTSSTSSESAATPDQTANGTSTDEVTVTLLDANSHPVSGQTVSLAPQSGSSVVSCVTVNVSNQCTSDVTNSSGQAFFNVTDTHVEKVSYTAFDTAAGVSVTGATVSFVPGAPSATVSTIGQSTTSVPADGTTPVTVTVTALDGQGNPEPDASITLTAGGGSSAKVDGTAGSDTQTANSAGVAQFTVTDATPESVTFTASVSVYLVQTDGSTSATASTATLSHTVAVAFTGAPSSTNSTVVASPTSVPAGGTNSSLITVTLLDQNSNPVSGQNVRLEPSSGSSVITGNQSGGVSGPSGANGQVSFLVSDNAVQDVTYTAVVQGSPSITLNQKATVTFTGQPSTTTSTISAAPSSVVADGTTATTITVTLKDANGNPVSGKDVFVQAASPASSTAAVSTVSDVTDSSGQATFTATDANPETVVFQATDTTDAITLPATATVTFTALPTEASQSSVVASPGAVPADGVTASTVTVTLRDASGNPISGDTVALAGNAGTHATIVPSATGSDVTGANGVATFSVTDLHAESVTFTATDTNIGVQVDQTALVTFEPSASEASKSTVSASPTTVPADGVTASVVTVTLLDSSGNPITNHLVQLAQSGGTHASITAASTGSDTTNGSGVATFDVTDTVVENVVLTATDTVYGIPVNQTATVDFVAPPSEAADSSVVASPPAIPDNGTTQSTVTVTLVDASGQPIAGDTVQLAQGVGTSATITPISTAVSNAAGQVAFAVTDTHVENVVLTATDTTRGTTIDQTASVIVQAVSNEDTASTISALPTSLLSGSSSTVTVTLVDGGTPVQGHHVVLVAEGLTHATIAPTSTGSNVTDANGQATFLVSDTFAETVVLEAYDSDSATTITQTASVQFTSGPQEQNQSVVSATPARVPNDGTSAATVTVTLQSGSAGSHVPIADHRVTLSAAGSAAKIAPASTGSDVTNNSGIATFTVTDTDAQTVTLSAVDVTASNLPIEDTTTVTFFVPTPSVSGLSPSSGPDTGGTAVTVSGSGFEAGDQVFFGAGHPAVVSSTSPGAIVVTAPAEAAGTVDVTVSGPGGQSALTSADRFTFQSTAPPPATDCSSTLPSGSVVGMAATPDGNGYWVVDSAGNVAAFGDAVCYGSMRGQPLNKPVVGMAADPVTGGYWLVASDGGIFAFNAPFFGSTGSLTLNQPIVGMTAMPDGGGYRFVAADGGIFAYGDAGFYGSMGGKPLNEPVVGMATTPGGGGYWLVASDGGIFAYGDAAFHGSMGGVPLNKPVVGIAADPVTGGYWEVAADGGIFSFDAPFFGSTGSIVLDQPIVGMTAQSDGGGYRFVAADGGIFAYGDAGFDGSAVGP